MAFDYLLGLYALSVASGGVIGYVKAGSTSSLVAGLAFGGLLAFGSYQTYLNPENYLLSLGTSITLTSVMGYRYYNTGKMMPAGLIAILSGMMVLRFMHRIFVVSKYTG